MSSMAGGAATLPARLDRLSGTSLSISEPLYRLLSGFSRIVSLEPPPAQPI